MANKQGRIGFSVDFKKGDQSGLRDLRTQLEQLQQISVKDIINTGNLTEANQKLGQVQETAKKVQQALEDSYNAKLDTTDLNKFQKLLKDQGLNLQAIKKDFAEAGIQGQIAFRNLNTELLTTGRYVKQTSEWLDKMANTLANTVRWSISSAMVNAFTGSIEKAYSFTKRLDTSLNDIAIVTEKNSKDMAEFAKQANNAAAALGATTVDYTNAALIYYQQGLSEEEVKARTDVAVKVANVTGSNAEEASDRLTAIWNGYKVSAEEAEIYIDKVSAVAATTAADLSELSEGMSKVASAANTMGVDIDQLNAMLATVISVTREDASAVGTAFKTIFARMGDLAIDGEDEFGVTLGDVSGKLKQMGINILDSQGQMREMGEVIEEVAAKWETWTRAQQQAAAVALAGKRQYNNLISLFESWDMYEGAKDTSQDSIGTLQKQQDIYLESMEAHLNELTAAQEKLYDTLLDPEDINPLIDSLTTLVELVNDFVEGIGGSGNLLALLGTVGLNVFDKQINKGLSRVLINSEGFLNNLQQSTAEAEILAQINNTEDEELKSILEMKKQILTTTTNISDEEYAAAMQMIKTTNELQNQKKLLENQKSIIEEFYRSYGSDGATLDLGAENGLEDWESFYNDVTGELSGLKNTSKLVQGLTNLGWQGTRTTRLEKSAAGKTGAVTNLMHQKQFIESTLDTQRLAEPGIDDTTNEYISDLRAELELINQALEKQKVSAQEARKEAYAAKDAYNEMAQLQIEELQKDEGITGIEKVLDKIISVGENEALNIISKEDLDEAKALKSLLDKIVKKDKQGQITQIDLDNEKDVAQLAKLLNHFNTTADKTQKKIQELNKAAAENDKKIKALSKSIDESKESYKRFIASFDARKVLESSTAIVGGITNIATAMSMVNEIPSIFNNEDLTTGEKVFQLLTSIGTILPLVTSAASNFAKVTGSTTTIVQALVTQLTFKQGLDLKDLAITGKVNAQSILKAAVTKAEAKAEDDATKAQLLNTKSLKEKIKVLTSLTPAQLAKLGLTEADIIAVTKAKMAQDAWNTSMLANPITWVVAGLAALLAGILAVTAAQEEQRKKEIENAKATRDQALAIRQESDALHDLYTDYVNLLSIYEDTGDQKENLEITTRNLCEQLGIEFKEVSALAGAYEELNRQILEARQRNANEKVEEAQEGIKAAETAAEVEGNFSFGLGDDLSRWKVLQLKAGSMWGNVETRLAKIFQSQLSNLSVGMSTDLSPDFQINMAEEQFDFITFYEELTQAQQYLLANANINDLQSGEFDNAIDQWLTDNKENYDKLVQLRKDLKTYAEEYAQATAELEASAMNIEDIQNTDEYEQYREQYIKTLREIFTKKEIDFTEEDLNRLADEYLGTFEHLADEIKHSKIKDELSDTLGDQVRGINDYLNKLEENGDLDFFARASVHFELDKKGLLSTETLDKYLNWYKTQVAYKLGSSNIVDDMQKKLIAGSDIDDELTELKDAGFTEELKGFKDKSLEEQLAILKEIRTEQNQLVQTYIGNQGDLSALSINETTAKINDFAARVGEITYPMAAFAKAASLFDENFIVDAENIDKLREVAPSLLEGATVLEDGSLKLNSAQQIIANTLDPAVISALTAEINSAIAETTDETVKSEYQAILSSLLSYVNIGSNIITGSSQYVEDLFRAHDRQLEEESRKLQRLQEVSETLTGSDLLKNLNAQTTVLQNQNKILQAKLKLLISIKKAEIEDKAFDLGIDADGTGPKGINAIFNKDGSFNLAQYATLYQQYTQDVTRGILTSNQIQEWEDFFALIDAYIADYNNFTEGVTGNNQLIDTNKLTALEESFEQNLKPEETLKAYNDFLRQLADENDFSKLGAYALNDFALAYSQMEDTFMHIKEIQESDLEAADKERLILEKQNELQEYYLSLKEQIATLNELQLSQLNEISEGYDTICDILSQMNDLLENQRQLHELIYGADSEGLEAFYEADLALMQGQLATRREEYNKFKEEYENATDEGVKEEARVQMLEAAQNIASLSAELAQAQVDNFKRQTENRVRALFEGIDAAKAEWDWLENESEDTMDLLTGMLKVGALRQTIEKEISSSNSLTKQAKLNQFLEDEIALLEQKDELTKYDLERAQARYDLRLAEIALEEAQANKSKMQLRRRSDGTYSYEYVTDENAIAEQQKAVFEAQQAALEVDQQQFKTNVESLYEFTQEFIDTYISAFEDNELGEEEEAQIRRVFSSILARVGDTGDIVENLRETMQEAAQKLGLENFKDLSDAEMKELFPILDSGMYNIIRGFAAGGLTEVSLNTLLGQSTEDLGALVSLLSTLGLDAEQFGFTKGEDGWTFGGTVGDAYSEIRNEQNTAIQEGTTAMTNLRDAVDKATSAFDSVKTSVENFIGAIAADGSGNRVEYEEGETPMEALARAFWTAVNNLGVDSKILSTEGYDTGGYTGAWGSDGRLALLHEKELVLNADDTRNILNSVAFVRDLGFRLNDSMMSALLELAGSRPSLSMLDTLKEQLTLEQNVHITAEFPNVDSQAEIEAAFEELINLATQKALENK